MTTAVLQVLGRSAGGIARHVAEVTAALDGTEDLAIHVAAPLDVPVSMPKDVIEVTIPDGLRGHRAARKRLRSVMGSVAPQVVHAHGLRAGIDAALAARGSRAMVMVTVHNLVRPEVAGRAKAIAYKRAERVLVAVSDRILAVSRDIASALPRGRAEIEVLHLGVGSPRRPRCSRAQVRNDLGVGPDERVIVTASRLSAQKALHVMLEALVHVEGRLVICGEGPLEGYLRGRAAGLGIEDRVVFLGFRDDVTDVIAAADVFCLSSVWEGVPLAAMEAAQLGVPMVATAVGGTGELIRDGESGRLVPPNDPAALAAALEATLTDADARRRYVAAASRILESDFSTERMLERLRTLYLGSVR